MSRARLDKKRGLRINGDVGIPRSESLAGHWYDGDKALRYFSDRILIPAFKKMAEEGTGIHSSAAIPVSQETWDALFTKETP